MLGLGVQWNNNFFLLSWSSHSDGETDIKHALKVTTDVARVCGVGGGGGGGSDGGGDGDDGDWEVVLVLMLVVVSVAAVRVGVW